MFFPNGLAGIYDKYAKKVPFLRKLSEETPKAKKAEAVPVETKEAGVKA